MKKIVAGFLTFSMLFGMSQAYADEAASVKAYLKSTDGNMELKIKMPDSCIGKEVFVYVLNPGASLSDFAYDDYAKNIGVFQYTAQKEYEGDELKIPFKMNTDNQSGGNVYKIFVNAMDSAEKVQGEFTYYAKTEREALIDELNGLSITSDLVERLYSGFGMQFLTVYKNTPADLIVKNLQNIMREKTSADADTVIPIMTEAVLRAAAENGNITCGDMEEYNDCIRLSNNFLAYSNLSDNGKKLITDNLKGKECALSADWTAACEQAMLGALIYGNKTEGNGIVDLIVQKYRDYFAAHGLDFSAYDLSKKDAVGKALIEGGAKNYAPMVEEINRLAKLNPQGTAGGNTGGSSGGNTGGGSSGGSSSDGKSTGSNVSFPTTSAQTPSIVAFSDLNGYEWAKKSIEQLFEAGVVSGKENGIFEPSSNVTREEFVQMISKAFKLPTIQEVSVFSDVLNNRWSYEAIKNAAACGIVSGSGGYFYPNENITREDMAVMLVRALKYKGIYLPATSEKAEFSDADKIAEYASEAVNALYQNSLVNGMGDNNFEPKKNATRAEAAVMLCKVTEYEGK